MSQKSWLNHIKTNVPVFFLILSFIIVIGIPIILAANKLRNQDSTNPASDTIESTAGSSVGASSTDGSSADDTTTAAPTTTEPTPVPSEDEMKLARAKAMLDTMSLEEKVSQMFFVRCPSKDAAAVATRYQPGGYILFANDFKGRTKDQVISAIQSYQNAVRIPLLIGVDEEGGTVNRVSRFTEFRKSPFLSPRDLFQKGGYDLIKSDTIEKCALLKSLGINVNLAPVCDLSGDPDDFIYKRSFSGDPDEVSKYVKLVVSVMNEEGMGCTLKHFPGYGNNVDTHTGIAVDERKLSQFLKEDFLPFLAGIKAGAGSVLVSHNIVTCLDDSRPASLSPAVHAVLREELGFTGVIMTDDLIMDAITEYTDGRAAVVQAVLAGNDLLICSDLETQLPAVMDAVRDGTITEERIDESVVRVLVWKMEIGVIGDASSSLE